MRTHGSLRFEKGTRWALECEPHVAMRAKRIFGKLSTGAVGTLTLTHNAETCRDLVWFLDRYPLTVNAADRALLDANAKAHLELITRLEDLIDPSYAPRTFDLAIPARTYQAREVEIYLAKGSVLVGDDVGLGKTATAIASFTDRRTLPAVVVTLAHLPAQWADQIALFAPELKVHVVKKSTPYPLPMWFGRGPDVVILNYHKLAGWADVLVAYGRSVVFDEVQELRRAETQKYNAARRLSESFAFKLGLSATPIYNYGGEIYNVLDILKPGCLGTATEFALEWCGEKWNDGKCKLKDAKAFGTWAREQFLIVRHTRADVGRELPDVIRIPQEVDTDAAALDRVQNTAAELARLILRATPEHVRGEKWQAAEELSSLLRQATGVAKAPYVADFVRLLLEAGERVVLCGWHRAVYEIWKSKLYDFRPMLYTGSESSAHKRAAAEAFISGQTPLLILSLRSGAGLDGLQKASSCIVFGELDWSPGVHEQCLDADTEVLTSNGFCGPDDIDVGALVAAFHPCDGSITWEHVTAKTDRVLGEGEAMYRVSGPSIDVRVTGGHRMVWRARSGDAWQFREAGDLATSTVAYHVPVSGRVSYPDLEGLTDADLRFVAWVLTDGHVNRRSRQLSIAQSSASSALPALEQAIAAAGFGYGLRVVNNVTNYGPRRAPLHVYTVSSYVGEAGRRGWREVERFLNDTSWIQWLSERQFAIFLDVLHLANGNKQVGQSWTQRSYHIVDDGVFLRDVQRAAVVRGWRANLSAHPRTRKALILHLKKVAHKSLGRAASVDKARLGLDAAHPGERVWCVTNPVGTLVIRRSGKVAIVGNCIGRLNRDGQTKPVVAYFLTANSGADPAIGEVLGIKRHQVEGIRNPTQDFLERLEIDGDQVKRLARSYLQQIGDSIPEHHVEASAGGRHG